MLNGKFYTGLPPKMIDRGCAGGRNRLESHLFWPDDTKTETAAESRIKRRNSVQLPSIDRPTYEKQNSVVDDVDTRKRFSKEFSQSSIQFYDNLNENNNQSRRSLLRNAAANRKMEIADKPTNTKLELPDNVVNEAYTAAKRKQAYTSKIEFYDYGNDNEVRQNSRNDLRKPKMDMNDKREMELNSKNSPKLQVKRDVRSLSEEKEQQKLNNREVRTMERSIPNNRNDITERRERIANNEENYLRNRRSVEPRLSVSPKRRWTKLNNNRYSCEREIYREPEPLPYEGLSPRYYEYHKRQGQRRNNEEPNSYTSGRYSSGDYEDFEENSVCGGQMVKPKRTLRNIVAHHYEEPDERNYSQVYDEQEVRTKMRDFNLKSKQTQRPYYPTEEYYDDEPPYDQSEQLNTPTRHGSSNSSYNYEDTQDNEIELNYKKTNNNTQRFTNNKTADYKINNQLQREAVASPISPSPSDAESSVSATKSQKHLRSSLCFNNGEIIGGNNETTSPTSSNNPTQRRNARSSATQRVSVGLPG